MIYVISFLLVMISICMKNIILSDCEIPLYISTDMVDFEMMKNEMHS